MAPRTRSSTVRPASTRPATSAPAPLPASSLSQSAAHPGPSASQLEQGLLPHVYQLTPAALANPEYRPLGDYTLDLLQRFNDAVVLIGNEPVYDPQATWKDRCAHDERHTTLAGAVCNGGCGARICVNCVLEGTGKHGTVVGEVEVEVPSKSKSKKGKGKVEYRKKKQRVPCKCVLSPSLPLSLSLALCSLAARPSLL